MVRKRNADGSSGFWNDKECSGDTDEEMSSNNDTYTENTLESDHTDTFWLRKIVIFSGSKKNL